MATNNAFFGELSFKIFCLFFIELFMFLLLSYKSSRYILDPRSLSDLDM